jgi:hypothetical protein
LTYVAQLPPPLGLYLPPPAPEAHAVSAWKTRHWRWTVSVALSLWPEDRLAVLVSGSFPHGFCAHVNVSGNDWS